MSFVWMMVIGVVAGALVGLIFLAEKRRSANRNAATRDETRRAA